MSDLNKDELKTKHIIDELKSALNNNNTYKVKELDTFINDVDPTKVRQSILDELDQLSEHPNFREKRVG